MDWHCLSSTEKKTKMTPYGQAVLVISGVIFIFVGYDGGMIFFKQQGGTVSEVFGKLMIDVPILILAAGVLLGYFWRANLDVDWSSFRKLVWCLLLLNLGVLIGWFLGRQ